MVTEFDKIREPALQLYRTLCFADDKKDIVFASDVLELLDVGELAVGPVETFWDLAKVEARSLYFLVRDQRAFPELEEHVGVDCASVITSFLYVDDQYINNGYDFILGTFLGPVVKYLFNFEAQVMNHDLLQFMREEGFLDEYPFNEIITFHSVGEESEESEEYEEEEFEDEEDSDETNETSDSLGCDA